MKRQKEEALQQKKGTKMLNLLMILYRHSVFVAE